MKGIKAFAWGIDENQTEILSRVMVFLVNDLPNAIEDSWETFDLRSFDPEINEDDIIIVFGDRAKKRTLNHRSKFRLDLPELYRLDSTLDENEQDIQDTVEKLSQLKEALCSAANDDLPKTAEETNKVLDLDKELPRELTVKVVEMLEKQQIDQGIDYWLGSTTDGRSIKVTTKPEKETADINLTFAELHMVVGLKEAFRVKELEIVYKPSNTTE